VDQVNNLYGKRPRHWAAELLRIGDGAERRRVFDEEVPENYKDLVRRHLENAIERIAFQRRSAAEADQAPSSTDWG
jgi:hypothetical protein